MKVTGCLYSSTNLTRCRLRAALERMDNKAIDTLIAAVPVEIVQEASVKSDFDFHSTALARILGAKGAARMAKALLGNEIRRLIQES